MERRSPPVNTEPPTVDEIGEGDCLALEPVEQSRILDVEIGGHRVKCPRIMS